MGTPTVYVTYNSFAPYHTTGGTYYPTSFGSTYGVRALSPTTLTTLWDAGLTGPAGHMVMSPDGTTLYVAEANIQANGADPARPNGNVGNRVYRVDTATHTQTDTWTLPLFKEGTSYRGAPILSSLMFSPDGSEIWVMYCRLQGIAPTGAPYETLSPPSGQTYWGSIEAFDAATLTHIGPLVGRSYGVSLEQTGTPYVVYFLGSGDTINLTSAPIFEPMALSPDGATLYAVGSVPDGSWTDFIYPYPVTYYRLPVIFSYVITPPSSGGHYSLAAPSTLMAGNVTGQPRSTAGSPAPGYSAQQFQQLFVSPDGARLYAGYGGGYTLRSVNAATGAQIAQSVNAEGATTGFGWGSFAYDEGAGQVYYGSYTESTGAGNRIHVVAEGSVGTTPSGKDTNADVMFSMDVYGGFFFATSPILATSSSSVTTNTLLLKLSGSTLTSASLPYVPWCVLADSGGSGSGGGTANAAGAQVTFDCHGRPCAVSGGAGVQFLTSTNAGHTFDAYTVTATGKNPSLLFDRRGNNPRIVFEDSGLKADMAASDGEPSGDWGSSTALTGLSGAYPICAPHPTDHGRVLMAYLDGGVLKAAVSYDGGLPGTWQAAGTIDAGPLDFTDSGRAGLRWLGETAYCVYRSGSNLLLKSSPDGGLTWGSAVTIYTASGLHGMSLAAHEGRLLMAAQDASALHLWASGDLGATWGALPAVPSSPTYPAALAVEPWTGRLWFGTSAVSNDGGATWTTP